MPFPLQAPPPSVPQVCICEKCGRECTLKQVEIMNADSPHYPYIRSRDVLLSVCCSWTYHVAKPEQSDV